MAAKNNLNAEERAYALSIVDKFHSGNFSLISVSEFAWILENIISDETYKNSPISVRPDIHVLMWVDSYGESIFQKELNLVTYVKAGNSGYYETSEFYRVRAKMGGVVISSDPEWDGNVDRGRRLLAESLAVLVSRIS